MMFKQKLIERMNAGRSLELKESSISSELYENELKTVIEIFNKREEISGFIITCVTYSHRYKYTIFTTIKYQTVKYIDGKDDCEYAKR